MSRQKRMYDVVKITIEIMTNVYSRVEAYSREYGWSKRRIIEDAIVCWLNQRDMEREKRKEG